LQQGQKLTLAKLKVKFVAKNYNFTLKELAKMVKRPGTELARRPLHFIWVCDCSASMTLDGKIEALNNAIRQALPEMKQVADENPNALVLVRTLRFSRSASWVQAEPIPLDNFQWTDLIADDLPRTAAFSAEFRSRLQREGAKSGDVQISLLWNNYNDLDLHVICPSGEEIYFAHKKSNCGGELDVDMNISPTSVEPVENVYWPSGGAPFGNYQVFVNHYRNHARPGCTDPTFFKVAISVAGMSQEFTGRISYGDTQLVHEFNLDEATLAGTGGGNTDMGTALQMLAEQLKIPPMTERALPPVLILLSDGQPTDDFESGLAQLMRQPWGKKAVRVAIAIGQDTELDVLQKFIGHSEIRPLQANNPEALLNYIKWASTVVLTNASAPAGQNLAAQRANVPITPPAVNLSSAADVW
jgi:uncharacterized protein YegL